MSSVVELYGTSASARDDRTRARVIASAVERLKERYPHPPDPVTRQPLRGEVNTEIERSRNILLM
jgi:hypothetical protein